MLLLDEPLNAVDVETQAAISELLTDLSRQGKTVIVATHHVDMIHEDFDLVCSMKDGRIHYIGPADEEALTHDHAHVCNH